jgi:hypothetical protein
MKNTRRYKLHKVVRSQGFKVDARGKTVYIPSEDQFSLSKEIVELKDVFGYGVQVVIQ